jgi:3-dehydroquinate synthase
MKNFCINGVSLSFNADCSGVGQPLHIKSIPRSYSVDFYDTDEIDGRFLQSDLDQKNTLLLGDEKIFSEYFIKHAIAQRVPKFSVHAVEETKNLDTVLNIVAFLERHRASKSSMVYVVGGGIVQDLGAFAAYLYKRGIPWTFVPTTLLSQADSCVGGKTALNHQSTKNLLALFSAPRQIVIATGFLRTLAYEDWLSGGGEILRLCITGGENSLEYLERRIDAFLLRDLGVTSKLIEICLKIKRAVVEYDEFELDIRRCMNYGHSFGHALEALTEYKIPHGVGVALGILVENEISYLRGVLSHNQRNRIITLANKIVPKSSWTHFHELRLDGVLDLLRRDKKAEGNILKIATLASIGRIDFIDLPLDEVGVSEIRKAYDGVVSEVGRLRDG